MESSKCKDCINKTICGDNKKRECEHYDIALTRSEILDLLNSYKTSNPHSIPALLGAIQKTYRINLAF